MVLKEIVTEVKRSFLISLVLLVTSGWSAHAVDVPLQASPPISEELTAWKKNAPPDGYEMAYVFSFDFDWCGQGKIGRKLRNIVFDKVESCGFSEKAKKSFYRNAAENTQSTMADIITYFTMHSSLPIKSIGGVSCKEFTKRTTELEQLETKLDQYERHEITLKDLTPSIVPSCNQGSSLSAGESVVLPKSQNKD